MRRSRSQVEHTVQEVLTEYNWQVTNEQWHNFCDQVEQHYQRQSGSSPGKLRTVITNYYHDGPTVDILLNPHHPDYSTAWENIHVQIVNYLHHLNYYPSDDMHLGEYSPDIRAYEYIQRKLPEFFFGCRLSSFIYTVAERAGKEWRRSMAALKRGGSGIRSSSERRNADPQRRHSQWSHCYLSSSILNDGPSIEEHLIDERIDTEAEAEARILISTIETAIHDMQQDPEYTLLIKTWRTLLMDDPNVSALASQHGVSRSTLINLKRRLIRQVGPILQAWGV